MTTLSLPDQEKGKTILCETGKRQTLRLRYFDGLRRTLGLAGEAFYAFLFSGRIRFLLRVRVARRICPVKQRYGANLNANAVSCADIPVNGYSGPVDAQLLRRFDRSPYVVAVVLTSNLSRFLKIWIYGQIDSPVQE
jgi:hypothetical protein